MKFYNRLVNYTLIILLSVCATTAIAQGPYPKTGDMSVCINATEPYGVVFNTGSTYQWTITPVAGGNGTIIPGATGNLISVNWTSTGTATLQVVETNAGCASNPVTILVTVNAATAASVASNNSPICSGADAVFSLTGTSGSVVTYNINGGAPQTVTLTGGTGTVTVPGATANQTLNLVSVNNPSSGCSQTLSGSSTVIVTPLPTASITANNSPICAGSDATFTITGTSGAVVTYTINGGANQTVTLTGGTATITVTAATANQTLNLVSANNPSGGCSQTLTGSSTVTVNPLPSASVTSNNSPICPGANAIFTLSGTSGAVVTYNINGGANQTVTLTGGTGTVTVPGVSTNQTLNLVSVATGSCSQALSGSSTVTVNATLTAVITANNSPVCSGSNATFTLSGTAGAVVTYNINGGAPQTVTLTGGTGTVTVTGATANQTLNLVSVSSPSGGCTQTLSGSSTVTVTPKPITSPITHN